MRLINEKLAADLLEAGKKEFLEHGFQGANLRNIASALGVTTGAIYRYYTDKEEMFSALVDEAGTEFIQKYRALQKNFSNQPVAQQLEGLPEVSDHGHTWMMNYIYDHYDAFKLIICCSAGTRYEHYLETLMEIEVNSSIMLMEGMKDEKIPFQQIDEELIHMLASALFNGMFETVRHDMPRERAEHYMTGLREFYTAGWFKLLGISG